MKIQSKLKTYDVAVEADFSFLNPYRNYEYVEFVVDELVYELYQDRLSFIPLERLFLVKALEQNKVMKTALDICEIMTEIHAKRNAVLISIGGGIIQDITGFVANILYRGIKWIFIPTTLLAACDSCIGGKTSLNYKNYKNLLGTFYPPDHIHICPMFFDSLSEKDYKSGLGEVVKFNLMDGQEGLQRISEGIDKLLKREKTAINEFVMHSLEFKKSFIEVDEFDRGERIKLNFAHTFGHAIEVMSSYNIPHGTAVAIGMIIANYISVKRGILDKDFSKLGEKVLMQVIDIDISLFDVPIEIIIDAMHKDKKQTGDMLTAVLMTDKPKNLKIVHDIMIEEVEAGFQYFTDLYKRK